MSEDKKKFERDLKYGGGATVVPGLKSYADDPVFVKMAEEAKIAVSKLKLPEHKTE